MSEARASRSVVVRNPEGVHARAATLIAELVRRFDAKVSLTKDRERVEATDVLQVLSLGVAPGEKLLLEATGRQAEEVVEALVQLIESGFGENAQQSTAEEDTEATQA